MIRVDVDVIHGRAFFQLECSMLSVGCCRRRCLIPICEFLLLNSRVTQVNDMSQTIYKNSAIRLGRDGYSDVLKLKIVAQWNGVWIKSKHSFRFGTSVVVVLWNVCESNTENGRIAWCSTFTRWQQLTTRDENDRKIRNEYKKNIIVFWMEEIVAISATSYVLGR